MQNKKERILHYSMLSKENTSTLEEGEFINVVLDVTNPEASHLCLLQYVNGKFNRFETYDSLVEFSTISSKEILLLKIKRDIISSDPSYFTKDDPRLHAFLSKLSYSNIQVVSENIKEFAEQFKNKKITMLKFIKKNKFARNN